MEPMFFQQLPQLMSEYKTDEETILRGLCEKIEGLCLRAQQLQREELLGTVRYLGISYLLSSTLTGNYELRLDLYDSDYYLDKVECCDYWNPDFITKYLIKDTTYLKTKIRSLVPQIRTYEIQQFLDGYWLNYLLLIKQFFAQMFEDVLGSIKKEARDILPQDIKVTFGEYMGKCVLIMGEKEA